MRALEILAAVELIGGHQCALLHLVENILHVDEAASGHVEADSGAGELLDKHRNVELVAVVAGNITTLENVGQRLRHLTERRAVTDIIVSDVMHLGTLLRDVHLRIDTAAFLLFGASVGIDLDITELHYPVTRDVGAGGFEIKKNDWACQIEFHITCIGI